VSQHGGEPPKGIPKRHRFDPQGALLNAIVKEWGSLENFITKFNTSTAAVQGSGWGWLVRARVECG
jgi:Fe-Mn family superoxide dismutase